MLPLVYGILVLVIVAVSYIKWKQTYWRRLGITQIDPPFFFGNFKESIKQRKSFFNIYIELYNELKRKGAKHAGLYFFFRPTWTVLDPELIKNILVKDFDYFMSHGTYVNEVLEPLTGNLFNLEGPKWRSLRSKLSPTFTSSQMKMMFQTIASCAPELREIMNDHAENDKIVNIKEVLSRFTMDVIGNCAFGIDCNTMNNPNNDFSLYGNRIFERNSSVIIRRAFSQILPKSMINALGIRIGNQDVAKFFMDMVKENAAHREKNNVFRKDFFHLLLQLKNKGRITDEETVINGTRNESALNINEVAAQCFVFFGAGFETSSTTMAFALYEIANSEEIQEKARMEIIDVIKKNDNQITYEGIMQMSYLEKIVFETLRKYPPAPIIPRKCTKSYKVPDGSNVIIPKGTAVQIPACAIHMDPEYYPEPERFDPERFSEEKKHSRPVCSWLPFGDGPRQCIGLRFGVLQTKVGLATILKDFKLKINDKTITPIEIDSKSLVTSAKGSIWLNVRSV
ncbi:cytochrome P450 6a2-like isoform X2 [Cylas formicarius]|uniref:cytochrome P450 6a2-like isoform X2 n=1 Tax=Cylas formicarius TaxID=197179 RepID=UPI0029583E36|nr:cytochrome P450 6a2-like isoform X2 [Cylas formicarius]